MLFALNINIATVAAVKKQLKENRRVIILVSHGIRYSLRARPYRFSATKTRNTYIRQAVEKSTERCVDFSRLTSGFKWALTITTRGRRRARCDR